jgi:hypothetical protein
MSITVIDLSIPRESVVFRSLLPVQAEVLQELLDRCDGLMARGFQELNGYIGRQSVLSIGGSWAESNWFIASSFGWKFEGEWIFTTDHGIERRSI